MIVLRQLMLMLVLFAVTAAGALHAQGAVPADIHQHRGFWIGFGLGAGVTTDDAALGGPAAIIKLGGSPSQKVLIGGEIDFWARGYGNVVWTRSNVVGTITYYPSRRGGFFLKGGAGVSDYNVHTETGNVTTNVRDEGVGFTLGLGYELRAARNFYISPNIDLVSQHINGQQTNIAIFSVGALWH